ncbi:hypothetical protein GCM10009641_73590 [Mycobacterium cookii]|uniref:Secreted protein n=1 Tax=Mycobacterium cookii TaxID=1775 RepID=A0A7I7KRJ5_9MYCO|nr:hypothetical protein [Mycobacterium cookii]MCV7328583.1 hypothetical protein [Mycobacterium cookii]BBX44329.1 hypothetical protein MCOO_03440 [Mycobacterium cookii]
MNDSRSGFGTLHMPRSRGAVSGLLLIILGIWGAVVPFVGPFFHFAYTPGGVWVWSTARAWLEVFPGAITAVGGFLLLVSGNRAIAMFGGWLAVISGAWFVVGRTLASTLRLGDIGHPIGATDAKRAAIEIASFSGLGALIVFLAGAVLARVSARMVRDLEFAPDAEPLPGADTYDAFRENAATTVLAPSARSKHRHENKGSLFRRAPSH